MAGPSPLMRRRSPGLRVQQAGEAAEVAEQLLGQLQHALAGQAGAQQQRQQLGVGQRRGAVREQLLARARIGGQVLQRHGRRAAQVFARLVESLPVYSTRLRAHMPP